MKIKTKSVWKKKGDSSPAVRVSRLRKEEICFYSYEGGGAEQKLSRNDFLQQYEPVEKK